MATKKDYPDTLNPFDSEPEENDDKNPFKDSDDEPEKAPQQTSVKKSPVSELSSRSLTTTPNKIESPLLPLVSPSLRYSSRDTLSPDSDRPSTSTTSSHRGSISSIHRHSDAESLPSHSPNEGRKKRTAPSAPVKKSSPVAVVEEGGNLAEKPPVVENSTRKKKPAPPPPRKVSIIIPDVSVEQREKSLDSQMDNLSLNSNLAPENVQNNHPSDDDLSLDVETAAQLASTPQMQQFLETWRLLKAEQKEIESELRSMMEYADESRTPEIISREQFLMDALVENVKKRQDLEEEVYEEEDRQQESSATLNPATRKMKKRRKFKLKKLLGVHS